MVAEMSEEGGVGSGDGIGADALDEKEEDVGTGRVFGKGVEFWRMSGMPSGLVGNDPGGRFDGGEVDLVAVVN